MAYARRPSASANADTAARRLIADARKSPAYTTNVETHISSLGVTQLRSVVHQLWMALANAHKDSHHAE